MEEVQELQLSGALIDRSGLSAEFWERYQELWTNSSYPSPFQSPGFLQRLIEFTGGEIVVYGYYAGATLRGAAFFQRENGQYGFLSDIRTDHNYFVLHRENTPDEVDRFFRDFFRAVREEKWALTLNYQPTWSDYWPTLERAMQQENAFAEYLPYSVCPVMTSESPAALAKRLTKSKSTKYYKNKMGRELGAEFEVFADATDLDAWTEAFADAHIRRWGITNTPSEYNDPRRVELFRDVMQAWIDAGILYRFAIKTAEGKRIAFCVCMHDNDAMLYHTQTYDLDYSDYRLGTVLLSHLGEWMAERGYARLDFGDGDESYKFRFANEELALNRVFFAPRSRWLFILKAKAIKYVRQNEDWYQTYVAKVKPCLENFSVACFFSMLKELLPFRRSGKNVDKKAA